MTIEDLWMGFGKWVVASKETKRTCSLCNKPICKNEHFFDPDSKADVRLTLNIYCPTCATEPIGIDFMSYTNANHCLQDIPI